MLGADRVRTLGLVILAPFAFLYGLLWAVAAAVEALLWRWGLR
jgi:hypothetical protein